MVTFILPGYSSHNQDWIDAVAKNLKLEGEIRPIYWDHWQDESQSFKPVEKARLLSDLAPNQIVNIVAKSVGTLVAANMIEAIPEQIKKVVFCGIPVNDLSSDEIELIKKTIRDSGDKIICYQNENDPHGSFAQVKDFGKVISKPASDHEYPYYEDFNKFLS
jgi:predicted alpha/beta hydrolase family esterase